MRPYPTQHDGTEKLRMLGCISIADSHEHTASEVPHRLSSRTVGRPTGQEYQVDDRWPSAAGDTHLCLECSGSRRHPWPTKCTRASLPKESGQDCQWFLEGSPRPPDNSEARQCVRQGSSSSDEYQSTDVAEGIRQAPTPLERNFEICNPSHVDHGKDGSNHIERAG